MDDEKKFPRELDGLILNEVYQDLMGACAHECNAKKVKKRCVCGCCFMIGLCVHHQEHFTALISAKTLQPGYFTGSGHAACWAVLSE